MTYLCAILILHNSFLHIQFQVTAEDQAGRKFVASSSSGVWKKILDEINVQGVPSKTHASGPEMLGLSHLGITKYIQVS